MTEPKKPIKINTEAALLSMMPKLTGIRRIDLENSLVIVLFEANNRTRGAMRLNLATDLDTIPPLLGKVTSVVQQVEGVTGYAAITYRLLPVKEDHLAEMHVAGAAVFAELCGLEFKGGYMVGSDGWTTGDDVIRDLSIIELEDPDHVVTTLDALDITEASEEGKRQFGTCLRTLFADLIAFNQGDSEQTEHILTAIETQSLAGAARLAGLASTDPGLQAVVLTAGWGTELGHHHHVRSNESEYVDTEDDVIVAALGGKDFPRPNLERVDQAITLLRSACGYVAEHERFGLYTGMAFLSWYAGRGSQANVLTTKALDQNPDFQGAVVLKTILNAGELPQWALRETPNTELGLAWVSRVS